VAPGEFASNSIGTLTFDLSRTDEGAQFDSGALFRFDLSGPGNHDVLAFTDDNSIPGVWTSDVLFNDNVINFTDLTGGSLAPGDYTLMTFDTDTTFEGLLQIGTGLEAYAGSTLTFNADTSVVLNLVPEPSTGLLAFLGLATLAALRGRRRSA